VKRPTSRRYDGRWVVAELLADRADRFGDEIAVDDGAGDRRTWADLAGGAGRLAGGLATLGVRPGDRVATMLDPGIAYLDAWFGSAWLGAIEVPVNTDFKGAFLRHVLHQSGCSVLIVDARWADRLAGLDLPGLRHVIVVGDPPPAVSVLDRPVVVYHELTGSADAAPLAAIDEYDPVYVMYTSGTSGASKGALHSNRSALWNAYAWLDTLQLGDDDVAYSMFPLFHVTARSAVITSTIWAGGRVALRNGFSVTRFWDDVRTSDATFFAYMGSVIHLLWSAEPSAADREHRVTRAFGAAAPPHIVDAFERRFGIELLEVYGSTELGLATAPRMGQSIRGTMGTVCEHVELQIQDEHGRAVATGDSGEICARPRLPHAIFQGYWADPEATVAAFRNLWFHSGDRGCLRPDGQLVFVDRIKDTIRRRGENISSFEVERSAQEHPDVAEAAAFAVPSDIGEEEVALAIVLHPGAVADPGVVFRHCIDHLPRFAVPRFVRFVDALPKTPSQRIQKYKLREQGVTPDTFDRQQLGIVVPRS
jgi:crotonobetaine/carnitine-CoA ligase